MPMELRKILFSPPEIETALLRHLSSQGSALPPVAVSRVSVADDPRCTVVLHFEAPVDRPAATTMIFTREEVKEALVGLCGLLRIPMPRAAKKVLWPHDDGIALMMTLETNLRSQPATSSGDRTEKVASSGR